MTFGALAALLLVILFRINRIEVRWKQDGRRAQIRVALLVASVRIPLLRRRLPDVLSSSHTRERRRAPAVRNVSLPRRVGGLARLVQRSIRAIERLDVDARLGVGDAMLASVLVGVFWSATGIVLPFIDSYVPFTSPPRIRLSPIYNEATVTARVVCIFHIRLGDIVWEIARRAWADRSGKEGSPIGKPAASH